MQKVHFIGICGVGMSAVALLLKEQGWEVTGADAQCYGPPLHTLSHAGIQPRIGYDAAKLPKDAKVFVVGRNAKLVRSENAEVEAAYESGKPVYSFPQMLGSLTKGREMLVVAGSYGKSTTTAIVAHILTHAGVDAGYFVGGEPLSLKAPAHVGTQVFVAEGDEYPSAHDDAQAKFLHLHPTDVLLTSVVHDHVNVYPTIESYRKPFADLLSLVPDSGLVVVCADEKGAIELATASGRTLVTYGIHSGEYRATNLTLGMPSTFTLMRSDETVTTLETSLLGTHNIENIVGASAYVLSRNLVTPEQLQKAVASFTGVRRRLDQITPASCLMVFEGFGSSYEKAVSAISALRSHFPDKKLAVVFEPHTFGWRNRANLSWYDTVFTGVSQAHIAPPADQGAATHDQLSYDEIVARVKHAGIATTMYDPHRPEKTVALFDTDTVVLVLTSGDLEGSLQKLIETITTQFPK